MNKENVLYIVACLVLWWAVRHDSVVWAITGSTFVIVAHMGKLKHD